jgi:glutamine synthetase
LGEHALERLLALKRQEWEEFRAQVTDWELARYLPVI